MRLSRKFSITGLAAALTFFAISESALTAGTISGDTVYEGSQEGALIIQTWQSKPGNRALKVDGDGDYVLVDALTNLSGSEITVQYWFNGSSFQSAVRQQSDGWIVTGWNGLHILSHDGGTQGISAGENVTDGNWHQITFTWKQGTAGGFLSYLDGQLVEARDSVDTPIPDLGASLYFGSFNGIGEFSSGLIDEVAIWSRALTEEEVTSSWFAVLQGDESGLVGYWTFDGENADDSTENEYHGFEEGEVTFPNAEVPGLGSGILTVMPGAPGAYSIADVPNGEEYRVFAFIDVNGNGVADRAEPSGGSSDLIDVEGDVSGVTIALTEPPVFVSIPEPTISVAPGGTLVIEAQVSGTSPLSLEWQLNQDELEDGGRITGVNSNRLEITDYQDFDSGIYRLIATNALGQSIVETQVVTQQSGFEVAGSVVYDGEIGGGGGREGNKVLSLDGDGDFVQTSLKDLSGSELTIQYWFKGSSIQSAVRQQSAGFIVAGWNDLHILSHDGSTGGIAAGNAVDGAWHHLAMTWKQGADGGFKSYLDGELIESRDSVDDPIPNHDADVYLGAFNGVGEFMNGMLDDVSIWSRALSAEEIQAAMNAPLSANEDGLTAYWNFDDGTAVDVSGSGFDGTLGGDAAIVDSDIGAPGKLIIEVAQLIQGNQVLCLDGDGDTVVVPSIDDLSGSELTIQYWFKGGSIQSAVRQQGAGFIVAGWSDQHILSNDGGTSGISAGNATDGRWHSVITTWKQDTVGGFVSYLDGEVIASRDSSNTELPFNAASLYFGSFNGVSEFMNGCIDEISVWNRARSSGEIRATWNSPLGGNESGLIGYWKFDDGTANDVTQDDNDGEFVGDATTVEENLPGFGGSRLQTEIDMPGAFSVLNVPEGEDYFVSVYFDRNNNGIRDPSEPFGQFDGSPFELTADKKDIVVTLIDPVSIIAQSADVTVQQGATVSLTVEASGQGELAYSWMRNGVAVEDEAGGVSGSKTSSLNFASVTTDDSGIYTVMVSNAIGSVTSDGIALAVAPDDITDDLVGYWKFDEVTGGTLSDASDSATAGMLVDFTNADSERWVPGQIGGALDFESEEGNYVIVDNYEMPSAAITVSAWVNAESLSTWGSIVKNWGGGVTGQFHFGLNAADGDLSTFLTTEDGDLPFVRTNTAFATGVWHHVAFTGDGGSLVIYQNGQEAGRVAYSGKLLTSDIPGLGIGVKTDDSGEFPDGGNPGFWDGMIDDLGIWGRALTSAEVSAVYLAGLNGIPLDKASLSSNPVSDPQLEIETEGDNIVLTWSAAEEGWILKSTTDLPVGVWQTVTGEISAENGRNRITVTSEAPTVYFRLERP